MLLMTGAALGDRYGRRNLFALGLGLPDEIRAVGEG